MSEAIALGVMLASSWLLGWITGGPWHVNRYRARLRDAARNAPGDQVAIATLERAMRDRHD
jgi:hypothetical protein